MTVDQSSRPRLVRISLTADERTTPGGTTMTTWRYFDGNRWTSVRDHPDAEFTRLDCGPGLLWQSRADLLVPPATWLVRVDRFPNHHFQPTDPMEYLRRQVRTRRYALRHSFFQVSTNGSLRRMKRDEAPLDSEAELGDEWLRSENR